MTSDIDTIIRTTWMSAGLVAVTCLVLWCIFDDRSIRRPDKLAAWAGPHGLGFRTRPCLEMDAHYPWLQCLQQGDRRQARNIMSGPWTGRYVLLAFDYECVIRDSEGDRPHAFSMVILGVPLALKPLHIRPKNLSDKFARLLGDSSIQFDSARFNRRFHVDCAYDENWAREVLSPKTVAYLLDVPSVMIQMRDSSVAVYGSRLFSPKDFENAAALATYIVDRLAKGVAQERPLPSLLPQDEC